MAQIQGAEFPIWQEPVAGPAVDRWNSMREENNNDRFTAGKFRTNYDAHKDQLFAGLDKLFEQVGNETKSK